MRGVTFSRNRYMFRVFECAACGLLAESTRTHTITCSPACRVRLHRNPGLLDATRAALAGARVPLPLYLEVCATRRLRPDLCDRLAAGEIEQTDVRKDVWDAWMALVLSEAEQRLAATKVGA